MPITYDPDTSRIVVVGGSEATPFSFEDIYQASEANGWNVVDKIGENEYFIKAHLDIGDYNTPTYFAHENFAVQIGTYPEPRDFNIKIANVMFAKGRLEINEYNPCTWRGNIEFKHCVVKRTNQTYIGSCPYTTLNAVDCYFEIGKIYPSGNSHFTLERCWINSNLDISWAEVELPKSVLDNHKMWIAGIITLEEVDVLNPPDIVYELVSSGAKLYLRDSWFDLSRLKHRQEDNETYVQWSFKVKVTDKEGSPIGGADVYLYNNKDELVFHEVTDVNGEIPLKYVTQYKITGQGVGEELAVEDFNPHRLVIEKFGYTKFEATITIDRSLKNVPIVLNALYTKDELIDTVRFIKKFLTNRWQIKDNELIVYDDDRKTIIRRFKLYDDKGRPSSTNVYDRVPVD